MPRRKGHKHKIDIEPPVTENDASDNSYGSVEVNVNEKQEEIPAQDLELIDPETHDELPPTVSASDNLEMPHSFGHGNFIPTPIPSDNYEPPDEIDPEIYEEVEDEEEEIPEPVEDDDESDNFEDEVAPPDHEPVQQFKPPLQVINEERAIRRKYTMVEFLTEYAKNTHRTYDQVGAKVHVAADTARRYLTEYIKRVKAAIDHGNYPDEVLDQYNEVISEEDKMLKMYHMNHLKDVVRKYSDNFNVDEAISLNTMNANKSTSINSVSTPIENLSLLDQAQPIMTPTPPPQQTPRFDGAFNDIDHLYFGITPLQLIRFGIINVTGSSQTADRISQLMGGNVDRYIQSEGDIKGLLAMGHFGNTAEIERFISWLKMNAHYLSVPSGFLALAAGRGGQLQQGGQPIQQSLGMGMSTSSNGDPMYDFYVAQGIYINGLPATHPVNVERLKQHEDRKNEEEQMKSMERKFNMFMRAKMLEMFDTGGKSQGGFGELFNNPMLMMMLGLGEMQVVNNPDGTQTTKLVPKIGGQASQQATSPSQTTEVMGMFKEMVGFMTALQGQQGGTQNSIMEQILPIMINKLTEKPPNQMQEMLGVMEFVDKIKGSQGQPGGFQAIPPDVLIQQKRMELDQQFAMRRFDLEEKKLGMEQNRLISQDKEAQQNVQSLMGGVKDVGPVLLGLLQQFMGRGAGMPGAPPMGGMMPGMAPQGGGMPPQGGMNPAELLMRMEYQKQMDRDKEERERKEREWKEEQRMRNYQGGYIQPPQPPQPTPETTYVDINQGGQSNEAYEEEPEVYTEAHFRGRPLNDVVAARAHAEREKNRLESYLASADAVIQESILNNNQPIVVEQPPVAVPVPVPVEQPKDYSSEMDLPKDLYDPDYIGSMTNKRNQDANSGSEENSGDDEDGEAVNMDEDTQGDDTEEVVDL